MVQQEAMAEEEEEVEMEEELTALVALAALD